MMSDRVRYQVNVISDPSDPMSCDIRSDPILCHSIRLNEMNSHEMTMHGATSLEAISNEAALLLICALGLVLSVAARYQAQLDTEPA